MAQGDRADVSVWIRAYCGEDVEGTGKLIRRCSSYRDMKTTLVEKFPELQAKAHHTIQLFTRITRSGQANPSQPGELFEIVDDIWPEIRAEIGSVIAVVAAPKSGLREVILVPDTDESQDEKPDIKSLTGTQHKHAAVSHVAQEPIALPAASSNAPDTSSTPRRSNRLQNHPSGSSNPGTSANTSKRVVSVDTGSEDAADSRGRPSKKPRMTQYVGKRPLPATVNKSKSPAKAANKTGSTSSESSSDSDSDAGPDAASLLACRPVPGALSRAGYLSFAAHRELEKRYIKEDLLRVWVTPPTTHHVSVRAYLRDSAPPRGAIALTQKERKWLDNRIQRQIAATLPDIPLAAPGMALYEKIISAHDKHLGVDRTWDRLRQVCLAPTRKFVEIWVKTCPGCRNRFGGD